MARTGRPKKPPEQLLAVKLNVQVTKGMSGQVGQRAGADGVSVGEWIRRALAAALKE